MFRTTTATMVATVAAMVFGVAVSTTALHAQSTTQTSTTPRHQHGMMGDPLQGVTLTPAQKVQIDSIRAHYKGTNDAMRTQYEALRTARQSNDSAAMSAARTQINANRKTWRAQSASEQKAIEAILTPEQRAQLKKTRQVRAAHRKRAVQAQSQAQGQAPAPSQPAPTQ